MSADTRTTVLVVGSDEHGAAADRDGALDPRYDVRVATDGEEALERLDAAVDVVVLRGRPHEHRVDDVVEAIREREYDCRVATLPEVDPSKADMEDRPTALEDRSTGPGGEADLGTTVERALRRARYDRQLERYFSLASELAALETDHDPSTLRTHDEYQALTDELDRLRAELDATLEELPATERYCIATRSAPGADLARHCN